MLKVLISCIFNEDRLSKGGRVREALSAPTQQIEAAWTEALDIKEPVPESDAIKVIPTLRKASSEVCVLGETSKWYHRITEC